MMISISDKNSQEQLHNAFCLPLLCLATLKEWKQKNKGCGNSKMQIETWGNNFNCKKRESNKKSDEKYLSIIYVIILN